MTIIADQIQNINPYLTKTPSVSDFLSILNAPEIMDVFEQYSINKRESKYNNETTLAMFLKQVMSEDRSCAKAVNDFIIQNDDDKLSPNTSGYCQARIKLPTMLIQDLVHNIGKKVLDLVPKSWTHNDRRIFVFDGSTSTMPDTEASQKKYPQLSTQKPGLGFPICRTLTVNCLSTGTIKDFAIGKFKGKGADEGTLLRSVLGTFEEGDLVLGDALFGTYFLLLEMQKKKVDVLFEQHGSRKCTTDFRKGKSLGTRDHLIDILKPKSKPEWMDQEFYDQSPDFITIREVKINHKILITSILNPKKESRKSLGKLYKDRWHVELDFRNLKTTLGMNILSCKTPEMCEKEMWMHVLAHNIIRLFSAQSAFIFKIKPRTISFKHCLQVWLTYSQIDRRPDDAMFALISKRRVGNRPGRVEPRAVKRRPKPYKLLMVKREIAREYIRKNGHPKK